MLKLFAFTCGWFQTQLGFYIDGAPAKIVRSPIPAYLIDHPNGLALFDTGLGVKFRQEFEYHLAPEELGAEFDESADIAARLRGINVDPAEIRWIINSHFHTDHCGGNSSIPNATVIIQSRELASAQANADGELYNPADFDIGQPLRAIDGELDLFGDGTVVIFPTFGHTPGHQSVRLRLASGSVVLAADCCNLKRSLDEMLLPPVNADKEASWQALCRLAAMRDQGTRIFYGHDGDFWREIPQGRAIT